MIVELSNKHKINFMFDLNSQLFIYEFVPSKLYLF